MQYFAHRRTLDPGEWDQKVKYQKKKKKKNALSLHIKLTEHHVCTYIDRRHTPPSIPGQGSKGQNLFSESSYLAYQIKENGA